jgi:hypothetical protein
MKKTLDNNTENKLSDQQAKAAAINEIKYADEGLNELEAAMVSIMTQIKNIDGKITTRGLSVQAGLVAERLHELQKSLSMACSLLEPSGLTS